MLLKGENNMTEQQDPQWVQYRSQLVREQP